MTRWTKVVALVVAGVALVGTAAAVTASGSPTNTTVTLCITKKQGTVRIPAAGASCNPAKEDTFTAADNQAFVDALAGRLADAEAALAELRAEVDDLTPTTATTTTTTAPPCTTDCPAPDGVLTMRPSPVDGLQWVVDAVGSNLLPGSQVFLHYPEGGFLVGDVDATGTFEGIGVGSDEGYGLLFSCSVHDVYVTGVSSNGVAVQSDVVATGPGCP
jgi:hypothetical protein